MQIGTLKLYKNVSGTIELNKDEGTQLYIEFMSYGDSADIYYKGEAVVIK